VGVDSDTLQRFDVRLRVTAAARSAATDFMAAITDKDQAIVFLEFLQLLDVLTRDAATAEQANVREHVELVQCDGLSFHASHRQSGHGAIRLIGKRTKVGVDVGNQLVAKHRLERPDVEVAASSSAPQSGCP
jgi:hypothetical protein